MRHMLVALFVKGRVLVLRNLNLRFGRLIY
jgi:hypothetical protein